jgi:ketosteroid isomerase-like protein
VTSNAARAELLTRALRARIEGDRGAISELYTDDVKAWGPALSASSASDLMAEFERRDDAFSEVQLDVMPLDAGGAFACVEWRVTMTHTGPLVLADGATLEPTGARITVHGTTIAEFHDERICALRQYWDELSVFEQLGLLTRD